MTYDSFLAGKMPRHQSLGREPGNLDASLYPFQLGHRVIFSTGDHYTLREVGPGLFEYVIGACEVIGGER